MTPETKIDEPNETAQVVRVPRARWRVIVRRILKYTTLTFLFLASCVTIAAWTVETEKEHSFSAKYGGSNFLLLASRNSQAWFGKFFCTVEGLPSISFPTGIEFRSEEKNTTLIEKVSPPLTKVGVGVVYKIEFFERNKDQWITGLPAKNYPVQIGSSPPVVTFDGFGIVIPHWMLLFGLVSLFVFIAMGRRFTLRMFLIWVTIACVSLGIALRNADAAANASSNSVEGKTQVGN